MNVKKSDPRVVLSTLWIFALLNYMYCDIITLMDSNMLKQLLTGSVGGMKMNENFLFGAAILMEIPIAMVLLSRTLSFKFNRIINIISGIIMTLVQIGSLFMGAPTKYYLFCSIIEICTTVFIVWYALRWKTTPSSEKQKI